MRNFLFSGIRTRLILLFFVALVPILLMIGYNVREERIRALDQATERAEGIFRFAVLNEQELLQENRTLLERLSDVSDLLHRKDCGSYLASLLSIYPRYANFGVILPEGGLLCSARPDDVPVDPAGRSFFRKVLESRSFAIGKFERGPAGGKEVFEAMKAVKPGIKAIFMSGYTLASVQDSLEIPEGTPFLNKPFTPSVLAKKVREVLDAPA